MNREETIKHDLCPQWLNDAQWEGDVELSKSWPFVTWRDGTWRDGTWRNGTWEGGTWKGGIWKGGIWKFGTWRNGTWEGGTWEGGIWKGGIWKGGFKSIGQCYWCVYYSKTHIKIGCKTKTVEDWKDWFNGDEEYEHKRDSEQFKKIKQAYLMAVAAIEIEKGE